MAKGKKKGRGHQQSLGGVRAFVRRQNPGAAGSRSLGDAGSGTGLSGLISQLRMNPAGLWGLGVSVLQLVGHAAWLTLVAGLSGTAEAEELNSSSPLAWLIVALLGISLLLTGVALFVCLFFGLRKTPRAPAVVGAAMAFFVGVLVSAAVFLQGLRSLSAP